MENEPKWIEKKGKKLHWTIENFSEGLSPTLKERNSIIHIKTERIADKWNLTKFKEKFKKLRW